MSLTLEVPKYAEVYARALLWSLAPVEPEASQEKPEGGKTREPASLIALATLALTVPPAIVATLEIKERLDRREIKRTLEALKIKLSDDDGSARLTFPSGKSVDLARTSTDAAIDLVIKELGG